MEMRQNTPSTPGPPNDSTISLNPNTPLMQNKTGHVNTLPSHSIHFQPDSGRSSIGEQSSISASEYYKNNIVKFYNVPLVYSKLKGYHKHRNIAEYSKYYTSSIVSSKKSEEGELLPHEHEIQRVADGLFNLFNKNSYELDMNKFKKLCEYTFNLNHATDEKAMGSLIKTKVEPEGKETLTEPNEPTPTTSTMNNSVNPGANVKSSLENPKLQIFSASAIAASGPVENNISSTPVANRHIDSVNDSESGEESSTSENNSKENINKTSKKSSNQPKPKAMQTFMVSNIIASGPGKNNVPNSPQAKIRSNSESSSESDEEISTSQGDISKTPTANNLHEEGNDKTPVNDSHTQEQRIPHVLASAITASVPRKNNIPDIELEESKTNEQPKDTYYGGDFLNVHNGKNGVNQCWLNTALFIIFGYKKFKDLIIKKLDDPHLIPDRENNKDGKKKIDDLKEQINRVLNVKWEGKIYNDFFDSYEEFAKIIEKEPNIKEWYKGKNNFMDASAFLKSFMRHILFANGLDMHDHDFMQIDSKMIYINDIKAEHESILADKKNGNVLDTDDYKLFGIIVGEKQGEVGTHIFYNKDTKEYDIENNNMKHWRAYIDKSIVDLSNLDIGNEWIMLDMVKYGTKQIKYEEIIHESVKTNKMGFFVYFININLNKLKTFTQYVNALKRTFYPGLLS